MALIFWVGLHLSIGDHEANKFGRGYSKGILSRIQFHLVPPKGGVDFSEVADVGFGDCF